jgi:predicted nucleic acid-binding protein
MKDETIVVNASPLIALFRVGLGRILGELWGEVLVPESVWQEVTRAGKTDAAAIGLPQANWAKRTPDVTEPPLVTAWDLGAGESSVLSLAMDMPAARVILDDAQARKCAQALGLKLSGTGGILVLAKHRELIDSVSEALEHLATVGFRISSQIQSKLISLADE